MNESMKILIAYDGSECATAALEDLKSVGVDTVMAITPDPSQPQILKWIEVGDEDNRDQVRQMFETSADKLRSAGLAAAVMIRRGNPTSQLLEEAESWGADCIFLGPKGARGIDRLLLGSVSSAVSARALLGRGREV